MSITLSKAVTIEAREVKAVVLDVEKQKVLYVAADVLPDGSGGRDYQASYQLSALPEDARAAAVLLVKRAEALEAARVGGSVLDE